MWVGGCDSHMPLILYLLCTGPGFLFFGNLLPIPVSMRHTGLTTGPPREHGGPCSGDKQLRLPRLEALLDEFPEKGRARPGLWSSTSQLLPAGQVDVTGLC